MDQTIDRQRTAVAALCRKHQVQRLAVFGSAARGDVTDSSDLDFVVEFSPLSPVQHADAYFGLIEDLESLFRKSVDLVELAPVVNPYFRESLEESQTVVYEAA